MSLTGFIGHRKKFGTATATLMLTALTACATAPSAPKAVQAPVAVAQAHNDVAVPAVKTLKRKIAIGRFTNETRYGKALLTGDQVDPLGKQTSDMLSARLVDSGKFLIFERPDLTVLKNEQQLQGGGGNIIGVDALIVGSLTEFGRSIEGEAGFLSNSKKQVARAKVEIRLVDVKTGFVFFSATGTGQADVESGTVMGFGNQAGYDSTLNDRAIGAAISDVLSRIVNKLEERPWHSDLLKIDGGTVYISGGTRQGLKAGDRLRVVKSGGTVRSAQTGFDIDLPPTPVADLVVDSTFGDNETNEASVAHVTSGTLPSGDLSKFFVTAQPN